MTGSALPPLESVCRLLVDAPAGGAWNMAVDQVLLESAAGGAADVPAATLRFYGWAEPTLSLGYFQGVSERSQHAASESCELVRRSSGGGAILHDRELTYGLVVSRRQQAGPCDAQLYAAAHETLIAALASLGVAAELSAVVDRGAAAEEPFLCFERSAGGDVMVAGRKVAGSAQRRHGGAILQHDSLLLASSPYAPQLPGLAELAGFEVSSGELIDRWAAPLADRLGLTLQPGFLLESQRRAARDCQGETFGSNQWTARK
jgi:lipoate-protein ligase A